VRVTAQFPLGLAPARFMEPFEERCESMHLWHSLYLDAAPYEVRTVRSVTSVTLKFTSLGAIRGPGDAAAARSGTLAPARRYRRNLMQEAVMGILWTIIIGFVAGVIAKFLHPGPNEPAGFILTTLLGIAGAFVATYLGQSLGWYQPGEGAGLIGAVVGAIIVLVVWGLFSPRPTARI
jgi:uncharacterized membrane protein YeaQ/YmgE (transglycosylase-associated protein family)